MRAYIVWLPIFGGDFKGEARKLSNSFQDRRVSYFLDPESETGKQWERVLKTERFIAWDVYLLYGADASWEEEPPQPAFWMHQLGGVTKAPTFLGSEAKDGSKAAPASRETYMGVVSEEPARINLRAAMEVELEVDEPTFRAKLKGMLDEMKAPPTNSPANGRAKVEFLYFKSCPGHKQALANLKAALRETKISADLALINVTSEAQGAKVGFQGSPSIRVNGKDLDGRDEGHSYGCRIYQIDGKITPTPTTGFIREKLKELTR